MTLQLVMFLILNFLQKIAYNKFVDFYRLGNVLYNDEKVVQRLDRHEFYYANQSKLTKPTTINPAYLYENQKLFVKPTSIIDKIKVDYIRKPENVIWGFSVGTLGQYKNDPTKGVSVDFELHRIRTIRSSVKNINVCWNNNKRSSNNSSSRCSGSS